MLIKVRHGGGPACQGPASIPRQSLQSGDGKSTALKSIMCHLPTSIDREESLSPKSQHTPSAGRQRWARQQMTGPENILHNYSTLTLLGQIKQVQVRPYGGKRLLLSLSSAVRAGQGVASHTFIAIMKAQEPEVSDAAMRRLLCAREEEEGEEQALTYQSPPDGARITPRLRFEEDSVRECSNDTLVLIRQQQWRDRLIQCPGSQLQSGNQVTQIDMIIPGAQHERKG
ncbi:hypothetical protein NQZ68_003456 [Dissostichus eleginoides]|nr:hypothetical protein NQZ68_003456 [Dissostichus eleginoides]